MRQPVPSCPKCHQSMQPGFLLDRTYGGNLQSTWLPGTPETAKLFGMSMGTLNINEKQGCPVTCFRCPACYYLEFYAFPQQTSEAETILLRPAQGASPTEEQQLLRDSTPDEEQAS